ncbi:serine/threonine-protein kinase 11-interacting protein-like isoform X2 [Xenia sp. Carnegie-2017]|uniref:serine/threonine-protein kinase 11-interacting protein-like isoform X2 n=1 Tax=Xenia sp. Carnegie-2017 TaxID=2897299 RepID=UPI001F04BAD2|nr:serine/threonine-protein kinase 11-interacting protein-like isoform X2 [Xenia sp. Carnegie-2017]
MYFYGNPISHHESYRLNVVSCLSRNLRRSVIALDDKALSVKEMCYVGKFLEMPCNTHNPSPTHGPSVDTIQSGLEATVPSGEERTSRTRDKKRKNRHNFVRQVSIRNIDDEEESSTGSSQPKVNVKINSEVEKLEKFKKDAGEGYLVVRNQQHLIINDPEHSSSLSTEIPSSHVSIPETTEAADVIIESPEFDRKELLEEVDSHEMFMISVNMSEQSESYEDMFVSVKNHELVERNIQLKIVHRLDLNGLLDVMTTSLNEEAAVVILKFDYVNKNRKYREYQFDDISRCEEFISLLKAFGPQRSSENLENEPEKYFKCIKCLTEYVATNEEISTCSNCDSLFVIEIVKNQDKSTPQSSFKDTLWSGQTIQHPDVVPCVMRESTAPPDVCKDTSCPATDGETFVDTEKALDGEYNCSVDGQNLNSDNNEQLYTSDKEPSLPKERSMSAKINISQDSYSDTLSRCSYSYKSSDSYLASSYSSQSGSEAVYSSSAGGTSSMIDFDRDSSTHCDHRLKLFLEMKFFRGEEPEEFRCMIKCAVASYGHRKGRRGILIVSNKNVYICRINGVESVRPKEWLSLKTHYLITELRYIECGFNYQSFRLEFAKVLGCYVFLVGDRKRTEDFLKTFRRVCKKARDGKRLAIGRKNPQTLANIRIQVLGLKDEDLMLKGRRFYDQAVNFTVPPLIKDHKSWFRTYPQSMLGADFIDWLIRCKEASNFHDAVHIGQMLLNAGIIRCLNKDCGFLDKDQYYSFNFSHEFSEENSETSEESKSETEDDKSSTMLYIIAQWKDEERWRPISIVMSDDQIVLADENHQWPLPRLHEPPKGLEGPQFTLKKKQKIINITEVTLFSGSPRKIEIEFLDEETVHVIEDDRWTISMHSENSLANFLDGIKEIWKTRFCIDLPVNTLD